MIRTHTHRKYPDMESYHYGCSWWVAKTEPQRKSSLHSSDSPGPGAIHGSSVKSAVSPVAPSMKERHCGAGTWWIRWCPLGGIPTKIIWFWVAICYYLFIWDYYRWFQHQVWKPYDNPNRNVWFLETMSFLRGFFSGGSTAENHKPPTTKHQPAGRFARPFVSRRNAQISLNAYARFKVWSWFYKVLFWIRLVFILLGLGLAEGWFRVCWRFSLVCFKVYLAFAWLGFWFIYGGFDISFYAWPFCHFWGGG